MNRSAIKTVSLASALLFTTCIALSPARADEWDKKTVMTIDHPILVPHKELPAGTYVVKLLNSQADRHIVQIFNADGTHLITTILAINNYRLTPTGKSKFAFWETPAGEPPALRAWFYPGDNFGQEFAYPKDMVAKLSASNKETVPTMSESDQNSINSSGVSASTATTSSTATTTTDNSAATATAPVTQPETPAVNTPPVTPPAEMQQPQPTTPPADVQPPVTQPTPVQPTPAQPDNSGEADRTNDLPHTASNYPAIALAGLTSLAVFGLLTALAKKRDEA